jgi:SAM-dependent methyltransferase
VRLVPGRPGERRQPDRRGHGRLNADFGREAGRHVFGRDAAAYDRARPPYPERVYELLGERCGLGPGTRVLEIGAGTGLATRRLVELGAEVVAVEPDAAMAALLDDPAAEVRVAAFEDVRLESETYDLAVSATAFHWVDEAVGLRRVHEALRPGGWFAEWWNLFGDPRRLDAFHLATTHVVGGLPEGPSKGGGASGPSYALDVDARLAALEAAGLVDPKHEELRWDGVFDTAGIRALYATFSPIGRLSDQERERVLDGVAQVADEEFGGHVVRPFLTAIYTARRRPGPAAPGPSS